MRLPPAGLLATVVVPLLFAGAACGSGAGDDADPVPGSSSTISAGGSAADDRPTTTRPGGTDTTATGSDATPSTPVAPRPTSAPGDDPTATSPSVTNPPGPVAPGTAIPGITPDTVLLDLQSAGFSCIGPDTESAGPYTAWTCEDPDDDVGLVEIYGLGTTAVALIDAGADATLAASTLGRLAALGATGSDPAAARAWVEAGLADLGGGDLLETSFGGVPFRLYGDEDVVYLEIGSLG